MIFTDFSLKIFVFSKMAQIDIHTIHTITPEIYTTTLTTAKATTTMAKETTMALVVNTTAMAVILVS